MPDVETVEGQLSWGLHLCRSREVIIRAGVTIQCFGCSGGTRAPISNPSPLPVRKTKELVALPSQILVGLIVLWLVIGAL